MPDVFLSYSRNDLATARRFAEGIELAGLTVWWDQSLHPGEAFDEVTEKALNEAQAVVVLWSKKSVASRWVRAEATQANDSRKLCPAMIEPCKRPIMFELTQTIDLSHWQGDPGDKAWQAFLTGVRRMVGQESQPVAAPPAPRESSKPAMRNRYLLLGAAAATVLVAGFLLFNRPAPRSAVSDANLPAPAQAIKTKPRIAILPFNNLSPDPANAFFADGMHEEVLSALSNGAPGLEVISRTTMMTYRGAPKPVAEIARELNAAYVLEGSVRRENQDVRLTLQLIDAGTDGHLWAQNFDRKLVSAMTLQSEVAAAVAAQLAVKLTHDVGVSGAAPTKDPVAYDLYLQARLASRRITGLTSQAEYRRIAGMYGAAIARDPDFGLARLGRVTLGPGPSADSAEQTAFRQTAAADMAAARRLFGDDPRVALLEARSTGFYQMDPRQGIALFEAAEARGLNDPDLLNQKVYMLTNAGRTEEAVSLAQRLVSLDPANNWLVIVWASTNYIARRIPESMRAMDIMIAQVPAADRDTWIAIRNINRYAYSGNSADLTPPEYKVVPEGLSAGQMFAEHLRVLRLQHRYEDILQLLSRQTGPMLSATESFECSTMGARPPAVAMVRGWTRLLQGNREAARADGREALRRLGPDAPADWDWQLRAAESHLLAGDLEKAVAAAREGMVLMPRSRFALGGAYAAFRAAAVLAWAGRQDEAITLLEELGSATPGVSPGNISREPVFVNALREHPRFKALSERLEARMAATRL